MAGGPAGLDRPVAFHFWTLLLTRESITVEYLKHFSTLIFAALAKSLHYQHIVVNLQNWSRPWFQWRYLWNHDGSIVSFWIKYTTKYALSENIWRIIWLQLLSTEFNFQIVGHLLCDEEVVSLSKIYFNIFNKYHHLAGISVAWLGWETCCSCDE